MFFNFHFRMICEILMNCDKLTHHNPEKWCQTFQLIRKIIGGVDYKVYVPAICPIHSLDM